METHVRDLAVRQTEVARVCVIAANSLLRNDATEVDHVHVERVAQYGIVASMPICPGLPAAIRRCPAEIVHIHMPNPGAALAFLMSGHHGKVVITHHADTMGRRFLRKLSDPFVYRLMQRADRIIVTSARYLNSSSELAPFREKCCIIPLGIEVKTVACNEQTKIEGLRRRFGDRLILAVGRLVPYKGFDVLIRAMKQVDAQLLLIGAGPEYHTLTRLAAAEGVEGKIAFLSHSSDLGPYLSAASIFVLPSITRAEAFGIVQLEAMAAGLPVINTDIDSGVPEVCIHGKTGITIPPHDPAALGEAIRMLLDQEGLRVRLGEAARIRVHAEYTADLMAQRTLSLYSEVLFPG